MLDTAVRVSVPVAAASNAKVGRGARLSASRAFPPGKLPRPSGVTSPSRSPRSRPTNVAAHFGCIGAFFGLDI